MLHWTFTYFYIYLNLCGGMRMGVILYLLSVDFMLHKYFVLSGGEQEWSYIYNHLASHSQSHNLLRTLFTSIFMFNHLEAVKLYLAFSQLNTWSYLLQLEIKHKVLIALLPQILMLFSLKALPRTQLANSSVGILIDSANNVRKKRPIELSNFSIVNLGYLIRFCDY